MFRIEGDSSLYNRFLKEWNNSKSYIKAHTSGSTGKPKEISLAKEDLLASARKTTRYFNLTEDSVLYSPLSTDYIAGKMMLVRAIVANCTVCFEQPSSEPLKHLDSFKVEKIDLLPIVPAQINSLTKNPVAEKVLKSLLIGGSPMTMEQENALTTKPWKSVVSYGMTETCSHVALRKIGDNAYHALEGITFSTDQRGCLVIESKDFSWNTIITNDIVNLLSDKSFEWLGRYDNVIITGALKVHPELMERKIEKLIAVPFYISGEEDQKWGERVILTVEDPEGQINDNQLNDQLKLILQPHECPKEIRHVSKIALTASGKIKR